MLATFLCKCASLSISFMLLSLILQIQTYINCFIIPTTKKKNPYWWKSLPRPSENAWVEIKQNKVTRKTLQYRIKYHNFQRKYICCDKIIVCSQRSRKKKKKRVKIIQSHRTPKFNVTRLNKPTSTCEDDQEEITIKT